MLTAHAASVPSQLAVHFRTSFRRFLRFLVIPFRRLLQLLPRRVAERQPRFANTFHKHRSRKQRRLRRNVIGFSQTLQKPSLAPASSDSSSSDEEMEEGIASAVEPSFYASETISFVEESFVDRVGKMSAARYCSSSMQCRRAFTRFGRGSAAVTPRLPGQ